MIIEAGYDLHALLFTEGSEADALRMVCLDADSRVTGIVTVTHSFSGEFDAAALGMIDCAIPGNNDTMPQFDTRYIALGYNVASVSPYPEGFDWERIKVLEEWLGCRGIQLLGIQVSDREYWASSGPIYSFATYTLSEDMPRAVVIPGPHPFASCECAACAPRRPRTAPNAREHHV